MRVPFETIEQSEAAVGAALQLYLEIIDSALDRHGLRGLSRLIGVPATTIRQTRQRESFSPCRRLANKITTANRACSTN